MTLNIHEERNPTHNISWKIQIFSRLYYMLAEYLEEILKIIEIVQNKINKAEKIKLTPSGKVARFQSLK